MIGVEVVASVVLLVLLAVATAMAVVGLLGAGGALSMASCPDCGHLRVTTSTWSYCPNCAPGAVSRIAHARVPHPHLHGHARPHWPHIHRRP